MEACGSAHYWVREFGKLGHSVKLIAPAYVKPFVKRQKNDACDAEAICEAAQRPTKRFVSVKTEEAQAAAILFRTRDLLVRQRTQVINAFCSHLNEFGIVVAKGPQHAPKLVEPKDLRRQPPQDASEDRAKAVCSCMPASFASTQLESDWRHFGNLKGDVRSAVRCWARSGADLT